MPHTAYNAIIALPMNIPDVKVGIRTLAGQLAAIDFLPSTTAVKPADNAIARQTVQQLEAYCSAERFQFNLPLRLSGSDYQNRIWHALLNIPAGETRSYGHMADQLQSSARAVGNACRANPVPIVIPCHRVVAKHGLGGYCGQTRGQGLRIKQWLLDHERT